MIKINQLILNAVKSKIFQLYFQQMKILIQIFNNAKYNNFQYQVI